jgi:transcriptional antiterminator NusG
MNYYVLQVKSGGEEKYIRRFRKKHPECGLKIHFPMRAISVRRRGVLVHATPAVFPGYIFIEIDENDSIEANQWIFRRTRGFYRFLKSNRNIQPLSGRDLETVLHFIKKIGPLAGISKIYFDENSRIVVTEGPLTGLEGNIIKVDKRKGRAKIKLDLYDDSFAVDLGFELIDNAARPKILY